MLMTATLNVVIERVAYRPLRNAPTLAPLITAIGMSFILQNVGLLWLGPLAEGVPSRSCPARPGQFPIGGVPIQRRRRSSSSR